MKKIFVRIKMWLTGEYLTSDGIDVREIMYLSNANYESREMNVVFRGGQTVLIKSESEKYIKRFNAELVRLYYKWHTGSDKWKPNLTKKPE